MKLLLLYKKKYGYRAFQVLESYSFPDSIYPLNFDPEITRTILRKEREKPEDYFVNWQVTSDCPPPKILPELSFNKDGNLTQAREIQECRLMTQYRLQEWLERNSPEAERFRSWFNNTIPYETYTGENGLEGRRKTVKMGDYIRVLSEETRQELASTAQ